MLRGAVVLPSAPLLVPGVTPALPEGVDGTAMAVAAALAALPSADVTVLLAAEEGERRGGAVHGSGTASLAGLGRPDLVRRVAVARSALGPVTAATRYSLVHAPQLPLDLACLAWHAPPDQPVLPIAVPRAASGEALLGVGTSIGRALDEAGLHVAVLCAGDLSAGLTERSPRYRIEGAWLWDDAVVGAADAGRLAGLERLGPDEAGRVAARGWAPLTVLSGLAARAKLGIVVRSYAAPRGVGYLVAVGT